MILAGRRLGGGQRLWNNKLGLRCESTGDGIFGSHWPRLTERHNPDNVQLLVLMRDGVADDTAHRRIFVDNPAALYDFSRGPI